MRTFIALLFMCGVCFAEDKVLNEKVKIKEDAVYKKYFEGKNGSKYDMEEKALTSKFILQKPVIDNAKLLNDEEKELVENSLKNNGRKLIHQKLKPVKNDYNNDFDRGTVEYTSRCRNYSFHKVVIPDNTVIYDTNFTQRTPFTEAIIGDNLKFINCNLTNIKIDNSWILEGSGNAQVRNIKKSESDLQGECKKILISHQVYDGKIYREVNENEEIARDTDEYNLIIQRLN